MPLPEHERAKVEEFFSEIDSLVAAYRHQTIRYITIGTDRGFLALQTIVSLSARPPTPKPPAYRTAHVFCEELSLSDTQFSPRALIEKITVASAHINGRALNFPPEPHTGNHSANLAHFDGTREASFERAGRLIIAGDGTMYGIAQDLAYQRELKANPISYESTLALAAAFDLNLFGQSSYILEIHASRVAEVVGKPEDDGEQAVVELWLAGALSVQHLVVGLRVVNEENGAAKPLSAPASIKWSKDDVGNWKGVMPLIWPSPGAAVTCIVSYAGLVQHQRTFTPALTAPNLLRAVLNIYDPQRKLVAAVIANQEMQNREARKLEQVVGAVLAIRGFRIINVDKVPGLQEVPDIVAIDAEDNVLIVECTLNMPNTEQKLAKLLRRREFISQGFRERNLTNVNVVAVLAVAQSADILGPFQEEIDKHRIILWNRHDLEALAAVDGPPNSISIYRDLLYRLAALDGQWSNRDGASIN